MDVFLSMLRLYLCEGGNVAICSFVRPSVYKQDYAKSLEVSFVHHETL